MKLFEIDYQGYTITLEGSSWTGKEYLYVNDRLIAESRNFKYSNQYELELGHQQYTLTFQIRLKDGVIDINLLQANQIIFERTIPIKIENRAVQWLQNKSNKLENKESQPTSQPVEQNTPIKKTANHWIAIGGLALKLLKSAKAVKVALAGASFASYSYLTDWKFAIIILISLVFHEYGHLKAMKKFGLKTKGIYLIPFVGGAAVQAEYCKTR